MIRIYYCRSEPLAITDEISEYRRQKIVSAKRGADKRMMISAAKVLKSGFADLGIAEKDVIYAFGDQGKPFAENCPSIHFSLAHSDKMSICAFSDKKIGIDCEKSQRDIPTEIISRYFKKQELEEFSEDPLLLWVTKEAFVKYTGKGMALGRNELTLPYFEGELMLSGVYFKRLDICGYTAVICAEAPDSVVIKEVP